MTSSLHPLTRIAVPLLTRSIIIVALVIAMLAVTGCRKPNDAQTKAAQPTVTSHPPDASKHAGTHDHQPSATPSAAKPVNPDQYRTDGTRRMAKRLAELSRTADIEANQYLNVRRVAAIREELKKPGINRPVALATLAPELLKAGQIPEAIEVFEELQREIDSGKFKVTNRNMYAAFRELSAFTWLRLAEIENCVNHHSSDSCLVPIGGNGFHTLQRGSRKAIELFLKELEEDDTRYRIRWYLNLAYMTLNEYPDGVPEKWRLDPSIFESDMAFPRFHDRAMELGVAVQGLSGGSVTEDFDCDGDIDIMASSWGIDDQIRYFQNQGDGTFAERTVEAGLVGIVGGLNLVHGDYDNDGFADVLVLRGAWLGAAGHHPNSLLRNRGDGTFDDVTEASGLLTNRPTQTAAWADFDRDGWLDLFIGNETWKNDTQPCELFRNNGDGTFTECAQAAGVDRIGIVKGVAAGDYDNDGYPDLYLSCMGSPNSLLHNLGAKSNNESNVPLAFEDVTAKAGVAEPNYSFPTWFFDYDNDGWLDLFVASYAATLDHVVASWMGIANDGKLPMLYHNNGDGTFTNVAADVGLDCITVPMGANYGDIDNDGWLDIYLGTGEPDFRFVVPNVMLRNGQGKRFFDVTSAGGFGNIQKGHGISFADLDHDGDQDIYTVIGGAFTGDYAFNCLFENPGNDNHWLTIQLAGRRSNRAAIGTRIRVDLETPDGDRSVHVVAGTGGSFGSSTLQQEIGLGNALSIRQIEIQWPSADSHRVLTGVTMDQVIQVTEDQEGWEPEKRKR